MSKATIDENLIHRLVDFYQQHSSIILISSCAILLTLIALRFQKFFRARRQAHQVFKLGNIPQVSDPPGLFAGDLINILSTYDNTKRIHDLHLKLGKTFGLFYGPDPWVMTVDLDLLQRVFVTEGSMHVNVTDLRLPFVSEINESIAQLKGDKWRQVRKLIGQSFTLRHMKSDNVFEDISKVCDIFMDYIAAHRDYRVNSDQSIIVDVHYAFKRFSLEVIFRVAFGREYKKKMLPDERDKLIDWLNDGSHMLHGAFVRVGIMFDWAQRLLGLCAPFTPLGAVIRYVHSIIDSSLEKRRAILREAAKEASHIQSAEAETKNSTSQTTNIGLATTERKTIDSLIERFDLGKMSDDTLKANLFFILLAGYETSANTLAILFYYLASNQEAQERLRQSILSDESLSEKSYLDWVIQETLRLFPAVPVAIGRVLEHDLEYNGLRLFKGTTVVGDIWSIHRWPEYWRNPDAGDQNEKDLVEDLKKFRPERHGEPLPHGVPPTRYFAFGVGPRYCIGQNLAISEIKTIVRRIISRYRVSFCDSSPKDIDAISPNLIHFIITHAINLEFTEISVL